MWKRFWCRVVGHRWLYEWVESLWPTDRIQWHFRAWRVGRCKRCGVQFESPATRTVSSSTTVNSSAM